jgi:hypothetical protein
MRARYTDSSAATCSVFNQGDPMKKATAKKAAPKAAARKPVAAAKKPAAKARGKR